MYIVLSVCACPYMLLLMLQESQQKANNKSVKVCEKYCIS